MKCDCYNEKATLTISKILAEVKPENNRELQKWLKRMEHAVILLQEQQKDHFQFQINYAKELNEAKKLFIINTQKMHAPIGGGTSVIQESLIKEKKKRRNNKKKQKIF